MVGRPQPRPVPADFVANCKTMGMAELRTLYHCRVERIRAWAAEAGCSIIERGVLQRRPMPDDFADYATAESSRELQTRYGSSSAAVQRWRRELGVIGKDNAHSCALKPMPDDFAEIAPRFTRAQLTARFNISESTLRRWCKEAKAAPAPTPPARKPVTSANLPYLRQAFAPTVDSSLAGQAQRHLQRIGPVFKRGSDYSVFGRSMPAGAMIDFAKSKGFDPDSWKRI